ncbi:MAG: bifunctional UDP-N-acetylglucosamine diphosphorylase/glucosamine-1-phosphate N-acetyltransferase GlmU [Tissierellia bacterium]|nr:bifunctional UDP-N-acetylglucosamine diphosphorylase/glucosamine-1-phosphate N-acetyltransferase GlmU [Tissierellia bacterium]
MNVSMILAAGEGTRMKSKCPKVLHKIAGKPILSYVVNICQEVRMDKNVVIVGHKSDQVVDYFKDQDLVFKKQPTGQGVPYGTGFAVMQGQEEFSDEDMVYVLTGDTPLIKEETLRKFMDYVDYHQQAACVLTAILPKPYGYGRIVRGDDSNILHIVEEKDASVRERAITEVNTGIFAFQGGPLKAALKELDSNNSQGELYLTDVIHHLVEAGYQVGGFTLNDEREMLGINSRAQLAVCEGIMRERINEAHMLNGVTFLDPSSTLVEYGVKIGQDTVIYPGAILQGDSEIGQACTIYGNSRIVDSKIGNNVTIDNSLIEKSVVEDGVSMGPYAHLRPNSHLEEDVHIGNFVEVKNAHLGQGTKAGHLAYIGDADVGAGVNIGCGVIFVNYNGKEKFRSTVKDGAFVGSNVNLVAPVVIEEEAYLAAGSTITKDVPSGDLAIARSQQKNISKKMD